MLAERQSNAEARSIEAQRRFKNRIWQVYGMTIEQYDEMAERQGGVCAICRNSPVGRGKTDYLVIDHCHTTGVVRELLCGLCNAAIGCLQEDPRIVEQVAEYLRRWGHLRAETA